LNDGTAVRSGAETGPWSFVIQRFSGDFLLALTPLIKRVTRWVESETDGGVVKENVFA